MLLSDLHVLQKTIIPAGNDLCELTNQSFTSETDLDYIFDYPCSRNEHQTWLDHTDIDSS